MVLLMCGKAREEGAEYGVSMRQVCQERPGFNMASPALTGGVVTL